MKGLKILLIITIAVVGLYFYNHKTSDNAVVTSLNHQLEVHFLDVGQADSILIKLPDNKTMLIDAGNNDDGKFIVDYIKKQGIDTIDYCIATHPHEDHIGAMDYVIKSFNIGSIYMPKVQANTKIFEDLLTQIKSKKLTVDTAKSGVIVIDSDGLKAEFIAPSSENYESLNNYSAVLKLKYGENTFLLTGDAEEESENEILKFADLKADLLKVGHHGSNSSSIEQFINSVNPKYAVISVGEGNSYKHPSKCTLNRLSGAEIFRTDINGTIIAKSDGKTINIEVEK